MGLKTSVIAADINNLSDARYFAAYPVEWMAFTCNPISRSYLPIEKVKEIVGWISGPKVAIDIRGCNDHQVETLLSEISAAALIVDNHQMVSDELANHFEIFRYLYVSPSTETITLLNEMESVNNTDSFILDFELNQISIDKVLSDEFEALYNRYSCYIKANINSTNLSQLLDGSLKGLVILGGEEEKVGVRSFEDIQDIMEELEEWS